MKKEGNNFAFIDGQNLNINEKAPPRDETRGSAFSCRCW